MHNGWFLHHPRMTVRVWVYEYVYVYVYMHDCWMFYASMQFLCMYVCIYIYIYIYIYTDTHPHTYMHMREFMFCVCVVSARLVYPKTGYCHSHHNWGPRNGFQQQFLAPVYFWKAVESLKPTLNYYENGCRFLPIC
jgi:hypothetical protein